MRVCLIVILILSSLCSIAQEKKSSFPVITLRTNPLSFIEADAGVMLGIGCQFHPRWSVSIDPGWIFYSPYELSNTNTNPGENNPTNGYKIRTDIKYYFRDFIFGKRGEFIALEFHYKNVTASNWASFGMNCVNGQCDFYQRAKYNDAKIEKGIAAKIGLIRRLWNTRWAIEVYTGIGIKSKRYRQSGLPAGGSFTEQPSHDIILFNSSGGEDTYPMFPAGAKFVYRIF